MGFLDSRSCGQFAVERGGLGWMGGLELSPDTESRSWYPEAHDAEGIPILVGWAGIAGLIPEMQQGFGLLGTDWRTHG